MREKYIPKKGDILKCHNCGNPASCFGKYDNMEDNNFSCDDCCGHGCEDGHCDSLKDENDIDDEIV